MEPITADTMPEARYRTVKKKVQTVRSTPSPQRFEAVAVIDAPVPAQPAAAAKPKSKGKPGAKIAAWWPVAAGIFLTGFVPEWYHNVLQMNVWAERLIFPFTMLMQHREIGISGQMVDLAPKLALYLQLPLEGLLTKITLDRREGLQRAIGQLLLIHGLCAFVLWMLTVMHS